MTPRVVVVGGCGHVGLPLGVALANTGLEVTAYDIDGAAVDAVTDGTLPFAEVDGEAQLAKALASGRFRASTDVSVVTDADVVVIVVGTPIDEHLNPDPHAVLRAADDLLPWLRAGQLVVLRSTIYPGVTAQLEQRLAAVGVEVAFCPERIAEGRAFEELSSLPQIVGARTPEARATARALFGRLTEQLVDTTPEEAELAKLFTNTWRYLRFAAANQLFMMANDFGVDYERVRAALTFDYPRAADLPGAGFAAGPCLLKDTMQLAAFHQNDFLLGHAAMLVNEGLPAYLVRQVEARRPLAGATVGILGMAFKAESDDVRSSLAYKLRRILRFAAGDVLCTDPYVTSDPTLVPVEEVLASAEVLFIGAPHRAYAQLDLAGRDVVDVWNLLQRGVLT